MEVLFEPLGRHHSLYNELLECPPDGFAFRMSEGLVQSAATQVRKVNFPKMLAYEIGSGLVPPSLLASLMSKMEPAPTDCRLTYSTGHLNFREGNWVVDCEHLGQFTGYNGSILRRYRRVIEKTLAKSNCKRIMPWSKMALRTLQMNIESKNVLGKTEVVRLARRSTSFTGVAHDDTTILFLGSVNFSSVMNRSQQSVIEGISRITGFTGFLPFENFYSKGGLLALETYAQLCKRYDRLKMVVRSYVPEEIRAAYGHLDNLVIIEERLPSEQLERLFCESDILLFPSHMTPGMTFLDAMNYELPIVTINACNNSEFVEDDFNGLVCERPRDVYYWYSNGLPAGATYEHLRSIRNLDMDTVKGLCTAMSTLIENPHHGRRLGRNGKTLLERGEFSIATRNRSLGRIFEESQAR